MVKGLVAERETELMRRWQKQGRSLREVMALTGRSKMTVLKHTDPESRPRVLAAPQRPDTTTVLNRRLTLTP